MVLYRLAFIIPLWALVCTAGAQDMAIYPSNVFIGTSANYAILSKAGVSTVPSSVITGNVGVSPIAGDALTGFSLMFTDSSFATSSQITGKAFAANFAGATSVMLTTAISDMETAYTDAASRVTTGADYLNIGEGILNGETLTKGVYTWGSDINLHNIIYIAGDPDDVVVASNTMIVLQGGVKASNIVWQVAGYVQAGPNSHLEGTFLVKTKAVFQTGSSLNGRILSQTAVTLDAVTITLPLPDFQGQLRPFIPIGPHSEGPVPTPPIPISPPVDTPGPVPIPPIPISPPVDAPGPIPISPPVDAPGPIAVSLPADISPPVDAPDPIPNSPPVDISPSLEVPIPILISPPVEISPPVDAPDPIPISPTVDDPGPIPIGTPFDESNPIHTDYPVDGSNTAAINERRRWGTGGSFNGPLLLKW
jgi:hypothetical protein